MFTSEWQGTPFCLTLISIKVCFECSIWNAVFCGVGAYATQHFFYRTSSLFTYYFRINDITQSWILNLTYWAVIISVYLASYFIYSRRLKRETVIMTNNKNLLLLMLILILVTIVLSHLGYMYIFYDPSLFGKPVYVVFSLLSMLLTSLALQNIFDNIIKKQKEREIETIHMLWKNDRKQYEMSKNNINLLNIKYHDLKYHLGALLKDEKALQEVNHCLNVYDAIVKTNNETLDVILTEKKLACDSLGIQLSCIVDGEAINFMNPVDIYSLFGNATDNAVEYLSKIKDSEKKVINIMVNRDKDLVKIQIENYSEEKLEYREGLPQSTKGDILKHGFGLKSIKHIIEKYKGNMQILEQDNLFKLLIIIPVKK